MEDSNQIDWAGILEEFSTYEGAIVDFCKKHKIKTHQLYYQRKKTAKEKTDFYPISLVSEPIKTLESNLPQNNEGIVEESISKNASIQIKIGKAKIYIPQGDSTTLTTILKELMALC